jgi:transposase-like protein
VDGKGFQALVAQLGDLSTVQREALIAALKRKLPVDEAVELIDTRFCADPTCGHCGSRDVRGWSSQSGLKRYRCKDCAKTFNALTGTPLAQLHRRDAWLAYAQAVADGLSLRKAAKHCGIALDTAFRWRHRFLTTAKDVKAKALRPTRRSFANRPKDQSASWAARPGNAARRQSLDYPATTMRRCSSCATGTARRWIICCRTSKPRHSRA